MNTGLLIFLVTATVGLCLFVGGVFVLAGAGWALIAGSGSCICAAGFIRKGLISE
ncbi:hypothetical protein [Pseudomonas syringae group genomosp. 3]|uniref:Uncharacterized protein n=1 Tax=Pseudomonas syringae pv. persicae TaxID=237306 RepID=A0AB38E9C5_9PSED|nr:hypothetical protein [Pseudomonas syringae group genomosp. 3]SOQ06541.1 hypothetical protein NCPPB2254_00878 [Pseudomonas syringae pv. persicae]SOQ06838.1 hypothetical protein CFBP1573P_01137 [Pseudomonas syringae pv. persicae]